MIIIKVKYTFKFPGDNDNDSIILYLEKVGRIYQVVTKIYTLDSSNKQKINKKETSVYFNESKYFKDLIKLQFNGIWENESVGSFTVDVKLLNFLNNKSNFPVIKIKDLNLEEGYESLEYVIDNCINIIENEIIPDKSLKELAFEKLSLENQIKYLDRID